MASTAVERMRESGRAYLKKKRASSGGSSRKTSYQFETVTPEVTSMIGGKQVVIERSRTISGGRSSSRSRALESLRQAETAAKAAQQRIALQKSQDAAAARLASTLAKLELNKITAIQQNIIRNKGKINQKNLIDSKTRNVLNITSYSQNGDYVNRTYNTVTGEINFDAFGSTIIGGKKSRANVTLGGGREPKNAAAFAANVKITKSSNPEKIIVEFPNGQKGTINSSGRVIVGARLAGHKYTFQDGIIRQVDDKDVYEEKLKTVVIPRRDQ